MATAAITSQAHNPGPWHFAKDHSDRCLYVEDMHGQRVAFPYGPVANARLIAAAPKLLQRLKDLLEDLRGAKELVLSHATSDSWMVTQDGWDSLIRPTAHLIAEAEGR
jgi:hypothetical protein